MTTNGREYYRKWTNPEPGTPLTAVELAVVTLAGEGLNNRQIGTRLGKSEDSIKRYMHRALCRLEARDRAHAVTRALRAGLLPCQCGTPTAKIPEQATDPEHREALMWEIHGRSCGCSPVKHSLKDFYAAADAQLAAEAIAAAAPGVDVAGFTNPDQTHESEPNT